MPQYCIFCSYSASLSLSLPLLLSLSLPVSMEDKKNNKKLSKHTNNTVCLMGMMFDLFFKG